ncbi:short integuments 2, mitochondrial isoform X2 [Cynara cardunculus var. scolymus]|uniref:short integuments 2, mitochondrial isoform X2 n=1 Tax=Cynara cardunculus var. scolymus TaxID=59895 RepID=UPI000D62D1CB|nr:short integuments 2, mitochondrial isoform X2 [Cynara cardunculus var. scolymus]
MGGAGKILKKGLGEMGLNSGGGNINWFPGHMAAATRAINARLKLADLVIEVRDSRIPLSSANQDLQPRLSTKLRVIALNKKDLANPNIMHLLELVELKLKEKIAKEPTLIVMVVGVPNVGKSALINCIHQVASSRFPAQEKKKRAKVGPLPGVTQDIAGFKIALRPSIYVLDTPGVLVPTIPDIETGLKLALTGSVKDSVVGEERIAQYLLAVLNTRRTPFHWRNVHDNNSKSPQNGTDDKHDYNLKDLLPKRRILPVASNVHYVEGVAKEVQCALYSSLSEFKGDLEDENELEILIEQQFEELQKALKISNKATEARMMVSKKFLTLFRAGKLGPFILDDVPL